MQIESIDLNIDYTGHGLTTPKKPCTFRSYALPLYGDVKDIVRPAVIICPGGGYHFTSDREGEPVASAFLAQGISVYILLYTCADDGYFPDALLETLTAVRYVREHAQENHIDPDKIFLCGFSAGGHCAATAGTMWNHPIVKALGFSGRMHRPDGLILGYPVITGGEFAHRGSFENLLGESYSEEMIELLSLENRVDSDTPRTFLWHTAGDESVPVQNSLLFARALADAKVPFEMHIYPYGEHGLSTARFDVLSPGRFKRDPYMLASVPDWVRDAIRFLNSSHA